MWQLVACYFQGNQVFETVRDPTVIWCNVNSKITRAQFEGRHFFIRRPLMAESRRSAVDDGAISPAFSKHRTQLAELAVNHHLPTMFTFKHYVDGGGLMSYGVEFPPLWRRVADYVARILKGAKPAELPIEQPTKFEFVVNLKTAKALGITIPNGILLAADEVIE